MPAAEERRPEFSQHFLRSRALAARLVHLMDIAPADLVLEVGPGRGALTDHLARRAGRLIAVEIDGALAAALRARFASRATVEIVAGDFLTTSIPAGARVAANLPYSITADAVRHVAGSRARDAHLVLQREAAHRFAGNPWAPETLASLLLKPWWHIEIVRTLRPADFDPPPRVESVLLWLARRDPPLIAASQRAAYRQFIRDVFGYDRSLHAALRRAFTGAQIERLRRDLHLDVDAPPSATSFDRWLALFRARQALDADAAKTPRAGSPATPSRRGRQGGR